MMSRRALFKSLCFGGSGETAVVVVFLRGGADGLNLVAPVFEKDYVRLRPTLALRETLPLDGGFGFHPAFAPLHPLWKEGRLAIVHAVGSDDSTRSHFEAQDLMEHAGRPEEGVSGGWIARHLRSKPGSRGAVAAVSIGPTLPEALRGAPGACALERIEQVALPEASSRFTQALEVLYQADGSGAGRAGQATFRLLERINRAKSAAPSGAYPDSSFGTSMRELARLLKADAGLEAACLDFGGWDTHFGQALGFHKQVTDLAGSLAAFEKDLAARMDRTIVVVMTEFGRRAYENETLGTDHGRASVMFAMGGGVRGRRIYGTWPGLGSLEGPGDLPVTTDYRDILSELVVKALGNPNVAEVFPGRTPSYRGLWA